jgi:hypothetical protein
MEFLAVLAAGLAGWRILVPIEFTVDEGGVQQQWLGRRRYDDWNSFRGFSSLPNGFILWPPGSYCPLDAMRGLYLPCVSQKAELADLLRRYLAEVP